MTSKFQNRLKRVLYRPIKRKRPNRDYISEQLQEAEKALEDLLGKKRRK